ncbi:phosphoribosyl-AMP cyclohydrolase [Poriferisphaera sp. WC338]|uniref:phosphoribosyl-AMP cyclohydrolase n=1 Tax=Poriferisphaera sp. WC338 TaxID=3425129 RepID=UPI003D819958
MADVEREEGSVLNVKFDEKGLVPAIVQDVDSGEILMMAWMNEAALKSTIENKKATFYSRSRDKMWVKGESSGHIQEVVEARTDCDQDVVVLKCKSHGPCCHVGYKSCFYRKITDPQTLETVEEKVFDPNEVYKK